MALSSKKVIIRRHALDLLFGYLPPGAFTRPDAESASATSWPCPLVLDLLDLSGRSVTVPLADIKLIHFVRDFNLDDPHTPERLTRRAFLSRPRAEGLWVRLTFPAGDQLEGLASLDASLLDGLLEDAGLFLIPPDDRANTHRIFVPRIAITHLQVLAVITTPSRPKPAKPAEQSGDLFPLG